MELLWSVVAKIPRSSDDLMGLRSVHSGVCVPMLPESLTSGDVDFQILTLGQIPGFSLPLEKFKLSLECCTLSFFPSPEPPNKIWFS